MTRYHQSLRTCLFPCPSNDPISSLTLSLSSPHLTPPCNSPLGPSSKGSFSHPLGCDFRPREMNRKTMLPAEGVPGDSPSPNPNPNPNPSPNPFVYPHEKTLLGYDDFHVMPGPGARQEEEDDDGLLSRIFSQHRLVTEGSGGEPVEVAKDADGVTEGTRGEEKRGRMTRKRTSGKTDRHSKIRTAQGLRDRRIRLSVQVSRKFFDLQDMLGFDKASNTIEWLITKSRGAIKGLSLRRGGASSKGVPEEISKCDVSSFEEFDPIASEAVAGISKGKSSGESSRGGNKRDSRERARVRAKERTREKTMAEISKFSICDENPNDFPNFSATDGGRNFGSIEVIEKFLGITSASEPSLHADPTDSYYSENANYSGDERFREARHLRGP